jgi:uncharacterized protein
MPEYLAPGVYVEEVSFRAKSIEGVSTSVAGFIGPARFGPTEGEPELLTSFADFTRIYAGIDNLTFADEADPTVNYLAHAVRAFFDNGGSKLYVTRVYQANPPLGEDADANTGKSELVLGSPGEATLRARFPGSAGDMTIVFAARTSANGLVRTAVGNTLTGTRAGDVVFVKSSGSLTEGLYDVVADGGGLALAAIGGGNTAVSSLNLTQDRVHRLTLSVRVRRPGRFEDEQVWADLAPTPGQRSALTEIFQEVATSRSLHLTIPFAITTAITSGAELVDLLLGQEVLDSLSLSLATRDELLALSPAGQRPSLAALERSYVLAGGSDGRRPIPESYIGDDEGDEKSGLFTFEDIDEISIVAAPGSTATDPNLSADENEARVLAINSALIVHCQLRMRYRVAVLDSRPGQILSEVRDTRGKLDSTHAAFYYPWVLLIDPLDPEGRREIPVPPSGFVAGIYARTDVLHGVVKAPANEVVFDAIGFERLLNKAQQDILNPLGINCFRFFEGRGLRLWGARTISSDPEWKYISVRRYFAYLEHSIDRGTQWAVFENNGDALWANVRRTIEDFLFNEWRNGALLGLKPEQAFFVRCDRSTMTQNDLDNGRLVCLVGVAVVKPAEFVIFRIGQMTADSRS